MRRPKHWVKASRRFTAKPVTSICSRLYISTSAARLRRTRNISCSRNGLRGQFFSLISSLRSLKRIADSQRKNQACRGDIDQGDKSEASCKRVGSIVEETDHIRSSKSAQLADRIDESEGGGSR